MAGKVVILHEGKTITVGEIDDVKVDSEGGVTTIMVNGVWYDARFGYQIQEYNSADHTSV